MNTVKQINQRRWLIVFIVLESIYAVTFVISLIIEMAINSRQNGHPTTQVVLELVCEACWLFLFFVGPFFFKSIGTVSKISWWMALAGILYVLIIAPL